jgi:hypothetical protein
MQGLEGGDNPTVEQALRRPGKQHWLIAMDEEYKSLLKNNTWTKMALPPGRKSIGLKWVLKLKRLPDGRMDKYKARLVVKGYKQVEGVDYSLLFAPVAKRTSLLYFLHFVAAQDLECHAIDFTTAFLNGSLAEDIYVEQPQHYNDGSSAVLKLRKALYGLKQAPRQWYKELTRTLKKFGFVFCAVDGAVARLTLSGKQVWSLVYVDDVLIAARRLEDVERVKKLLLDSYEGTDKGPLKYFLGLKIYRDRACRLLYADQSTLAARIVQEAGLMEANPKDIPLPPNQHKDPLGELLEENDVQQYRKVVGELMYLANMTRPDLAYSAGYLARFLQSPSQAHQHQLKEVLRYVKSSCEYVLTLGCQSAKTLVGFVDSDWAQEPGRKSVFGFCFMDQGSVVSWKSKRLLTVSTSSMEAEYMAGGEAVKEAVYLTWLRHFLFGGCDAIPVYIDNGSALTVIKNPVIEDRRKHIDVIHNHVREREAAGYVNFSWIPSRENVADVFTKALPRPAFQKFRASLRLSVADR